MVFSLEGGRGAALIRSAAPKIAFAWKAWAHFCGMAVIALAIGVAIVQAVSGRDAVFTVTDLRFPGGTLVDGFWTIRTPLKGRYEYHYAAERHESCPGEVVTIFESANSPTPAVITLRKPAMLMEPKVYPDTKINNPLPDTVTPGLWEVNTSLVSHCANREWTDLIARFRIEVTS